MLFNSYAFLIFLLFAFVLYWRIKNLRVQNVFLISASYFFYGWWDWRFLSLIICSSLADYLIGLRLYRTEDPRNRTLLLTSSLVINLGLLGFFKYYNFFIDSAGDLLTNLGFQPNLSSLNVLLPVGISFYTFQTLSYTIDIYRKQLEPTKDPLAFFAFVSFFPQLVAGPIERAKQFLPQFLRQRKFDEVSATDGLRQMLWGFFKKVVVADQCAIVVDFCFSQHPEITWYMHVTGMVFFAFQIYGDFSGYSDIAIGLGRLFGFNLMQNFAYPYFSRDIAEFWRRWHISLSTWFRDYVYIPLGGSFVTKWRRIRNILITFTVSGFWHGASWNFIFWGFLNGGYYLPLMLAGQHKSHTGTVAPGRVLPGRYDVYRMLRTFTLVCLAWVFFRAPDLPSAIEYLLAMIGFHDGSRTLTGPLVLDFLIGFLGILLLIAVEWVQRDQQHALERLPRALWMRWCIYLLLGSLIMSLFGSQQTFIYFQF